MQIIPLSEGSFTIDHTKEFVPFDTSTDDLQQRPKGSLLVEIQPFLVITEKDVILLDTGLGFTDKHHILDLHHHIALHVDPTSVTKVLLSHLHKDHAGGISRLDPILGNYELSFPYATYFVGKQELEFALRAGNPSYHPDRLSILRNASNLVLLEESGVIDDYIRHQTTGAHSPYHQVFWIEEGGSCVFFGADDAPQLQQMKSRFVAKYDYDGKKAMQLRNEWWQRGKEEQWLFLFYHDIQTPTYRP